VTDGPSIQFDAFKTCAYEGGIIGASDMAASSAHVLTIHAPAIGLKSYASTQYGHRITSVIFFSWRGLISRYVANFFEKKAARERAALSALSILSNAD
jgi:hypothetical protein